ncbi:MAG: 2-C-methyl-D-erythritol 4-phosphate cytidylyltransferase [Saprospiraceae bacterium]|nr:2-C-methyl-D-erythritol 4-phosphate cytidylyltransferase [Saprospiraceae bacterium]
MQRTAIIVAGGSGQRFGSEIPKQLHLLAGKPILVWSIEKFKQAYADMTIILVVHPSLEATIQDLLDKYHLKDVAIALGGATRTESVKHGLALAPKHGVIGIHDAVRPLVSESVIKNCYETAAEKGSAIPAIPMVNSIREVDVTGQSRVVDRTKYKMIQTPQCFRAEWLHEAYRQTKEASFSDDASVVQSANFSIFLVEGNVENIKITTPTDLLVANALITH